MKKNKIIKKIGLFLGCNIPFRAPDIEQSFRKIFPKFNIDIVDLIGATCCPTWGTAPSFDMNTWLSISARNIAIAEEMNLDIMTGCNSCFGILNEARSILIKNKSIHNDINKTLLSINRKYMGTSDIFHLVHILYNEIGRKRIKDSIKYSLKKIRIAVQPGCHLLWPVKKIKIREINPYFPTILKELCEALGAEVPHYSRLESCCGSGALRNIDQEKSLYIVLEKLLSMKNEINPHMIVTSCSSCYLQLDTAQNILNKRGIIDFEIPVFYYSQLLALCMGIEPELVASISETNRERVISKFL